MTRAAARIAAAVSLALALGCRSEAFEGAGEEPSAASTDPTHPERDAARERLARELADARASTDFEATPTSDDRFGADPYRIAALPTSAGPRFVVLARGADQLLLVDAGGHVLDTAPAPRQPTDVVLAEDELLVVGLGAREVARFGFTADELEPRTSVPLPDASSPRAIAVDVRRRRVWVVDEGNHHLHALRGIGETLAVERSQPHCRGPLDVVVANGHLLTNCLLEHRVRIDDYDGQARATIEHDGPMWSMATHGELVAVTGVEDHPLERRDGGFGHVDSFVFIYRIATDGEPSRVATINSSALGVVTPKWARWDGATRLAVAGYATPDLLEFQWPMPGPLEGSPAPTIVRTPWMPGTTDAVRVGDGRWLATNQLLDGILVHDGDESSLAPVDDGDDRNFDVRLGEALAFTTAMAPWNDSEAERSRFTCETCHFEGRVDGRTHFTGRERDGARVHATSKPLYGLVSNAPHFSRALDRSTDVMVDNEFGVANRFSAREVAREGWFRVRTDDLPWLAELPGWPGEVDGEGLRRALTAFFHRFSPPQNPNVRGRDDYSPLEARGAQQFAERCEGCHEARLVADDPDTRQPPDRWPALIFANGPIVWGTDAYAQTSIQPWVHDEGARVPSLRRLHLKWPYFTNGSADSLDAVLEGFRVDPSDHDIGPTADPTRALSADERRAIAAFLALL